MKLTDHISMVGKGQYSSGLPSDYDSGVFLVRVARQRWLIDAGSGYDIRALQAAVRSELAGEPLDGIAITHSHSDHAGGAKSLSAEFGCMVYASGDTARRMASHDVEAVAADSAIRAGIYPPDHRFGWLDNLLPPPQRPVPRTVFVVLLALASPGEQYRIGGGSPRVAGMGVVLGGVAGLTITSRRRSVRRRRLTAAPFGNNPTAASASLKETHVNEHERPDVTADPADTGMTRRRLIQAAGVTAGALAAGPLLPGAVSAAASASASPSGVIATAAAGLVPAADNVPDAVMAGPPVDAGPYLTTNQGLRIADDQNSLKAGTRGPTLLEDFALREKIMHFDHERIPERVVHARGAGAHGTFRLHRSLQQFTKAKLLTDTTATTQVFVRFSTVNGSRGSADTARDARGFATKFYTTEGVWDLVGNNIPVFFIQDAIKFPDLVHAFKPEPMLEIPQASTAHNSFWDYISLTPESMHMIMWIMSDRGIPRSLRMMEGFGVHTFRLVNEQGRSTYVKFHWKPALGVHSLVWDEAQKLGGIDPDFHRRDLAQAITDKQYPHFDLGVQLLAEADVAKVGFDILDATKLWPEEIIPVTRVGTMTLDRNPDNYFAETEQVAFHLGHIVPGIDFTDDPLLQGRLFSYLDTQINRFGSANFHQLPINASHSPVNNYQQDSSMRYANRPGNINYEPNSLGGDAKEAPSSAGGFVSYPEVVQGPKVRTRSATFSDHFTQATLFYRSLTTPEQQHVIDALRFELGKVGALTVKQRMLTLLANIDRRLVHEVAEALGLPTPGGHIASGVRPSPALSEEHTPKSASTRKVAILTSDGVTASDITDLQRILTAAGVHSFIIAPHEGIITSSTGRKLTVDFSILTSASVQYDALYIPDGKAAVATLKTNGAALHFVEETFKHYKTIAATGTGRDLITAAIGVPRVLTQPGIVAGQHAASIGNEVVAAIKTDRHWTRTGTGQVSA